MLCQLADLQSTFSIFHHSPLTGVTLQMLLWLWRLRAVSTDAALGSRGQLPIVSPAPSALPLGHAFRPAQGGLIVCMVAVLVLFLAIVVGILFPVVTAAAGLGPLAMSAVHTDRTAS